MGLSIQEMAITKASTIACAIKDRLRSRDATLAWSWIVVTSKTIPLGKWEMKVYYMYIHYIYTYTYVCVSQLETEIVGQILGLFWIPIFFVDQPAMYLHLHRFVWTELPHVFNIHIYFPMFHPTHIFLPVWTNNVWKPSALHSIALAG